MVLEEIRGNVFDNTGDRVPVHCISQDCNMGAGIAVEMKKRFKLGSLIADDFPDCILYHNVLNLVTKRKHYDKPSYESLEKALDVMKEICIENCITRLVMPKIGCGLDRLQWPKVRGILEKVLGDTDMDVLVCVL